MIASIILPCFNEWEEIFKNMEFLNLYLKKYLENIDFEFILVNDWSEDNTSQEIKRLEEKYDFIKVVDYWVNMWKWFAISKGLREANWDIIAFYDSDLDIEPDSLVEHIKYLLKNEKYHIVIWSKTHEKSNVVYPLMRIIMLNFNVVLNKMLFSMSVKDTQTWLKVFRKELKEIFLENVKMFWYAFDVEFLYNLEKKNYKIKELSVRVNLSSNSAVNFFSIVRYLRELMIFYKKITFMASYKKVTLFTKIRLKIIKFIVFPIENFVNFSFYIRDKKHWFWVKKH